MQHATHIKKKPQKNRLYVKKYFDIDDWLTERKKLASEMME